MRKGAKLDALRNGFVGFVMFLDFNPELNTLKFQKLMPLKSKTLNLSQEQNIIIQLYTSKMCAKFQRDIFNFGCAMPQKQSETDDVTF